MHNPSELPKHQYTCQEYREEMILAALQRTMQRPDLSAEDRERLQREISRLEKAMGL